MLPAVRESTRRTAGWRAIRSKKRTGSSTFGSTDSPLRVAVAGTPYEFTQAPDDPSVLAAALRAGVALEYECNSGGCGTCRMKVLEGQACATREDPTGLSERDRRRGLRLACQTRATSDLTIEARVRTAPDALRPRRLPARPLDVRELTSDMRAFRFVTG